MKKYFNLVDYIVFGVSVICLLWIAFYKLSWLNLEPLFVNADKWADIIYTVFTSILAAGFFYIATIFLPKISQIKNMRNRIFNHMNDYDRISNLILSRIENSNTNKCYKLDEYLDTLKKNDFESNEFKKLNKDFNTAFVIGDNAPVIFKLISVQKNYLNNILFTYKSILPNDVFEQVSHLCNIMFQTIDPIVSDKQELKTNGYFNIFNQLILLGDFIKTHKVFKNETIQWLCK